MLQEKIKFCNKNLQQNTGISWLCKKYFLHAKLYVCKEREMG